MNPGETFCLEISNANELYNYMLLLREMKDKVIRNVWSDHKEYIIESSLDPKIFFVTPVSWYDRGDAKRASNNAWFPYLKYPLKVL
jgi:hypothetical protein